MAEFEGKTIVVTGAAGGIGQAIVMRFAGEGGRVIAVDKNEDWLGELVTRATAQGYAVEPLPVDCSSFVAVSAAAATIAARFGEIDVLINNCGQSVREKSAEFTYSDPAIWDVLIDTNLRPTLNWTRVLAPGMRERGFGKIVNIASESAIYGDLKLVDYAAAKGGVIGFTRGIARELAPYGINVNAVSPGVTRTRAIEAVPKDVVDAAIAQIPRGQICEPEDMAAVIRFLASHDAIGVVGQNIIVSGGRTMQ